MKYRTGEWGTRESLLTDRADDRLYFLLFTPGASPALAIRNTEITKKPRPLRLCVLSASVFLFPAKLQEVMLRVTKSALLKRRFHATRTAKPNR